jgi:predicted DNA-binding transcriptional regulator YafY
MNRIDRISAILIQLQSKKVVKAQEIADRFNISLRTVYRDVSTLEEAGIPIIGEAGVGYSIMEGYRLPPVMFTREEATAFITAEKLVEKFADNAIGAQYKSAMFKVRAVLRGAEKEFIEHLDERIEALKYRNLPDTSPRDSTLQTILQSITEKRILQMEYYAWHNEKTTQRSIEPIGVCHTNSHWHLIGWCRLRNDYRDFRIDRIQTLKLTDERFKERDLSLKQYLQQMAEKEKMETVRVLFSKAVTKHLGEQKYYFGFVQETDMGDEGVEMTFLSASLEGFARWILMFTIHAKVVEPFELNTRLRELTEELQQHYTLVPVE